MTFKTFTGLTIIIIANQYKHAFTQITTKASLRLNKFLKTAVSEQQEDDKTASVGSC